MIRIMLLLSFFAASALAEPTAADRADTDGKAASDHGDYDKAIAFYTLAIKEDGTNPSPDMDRGNAYSELGKLDEALADYEAAIVKTIALTDSLHDKRLAPIFYNRGYAYEHTGHAKEALANYDVAIHLDPAYSDSHGRAAWILATHPDAAFRKPVKALEYALAEVKISRMQDADDLDTLAAAYAANGRFDEARNHEKQAMTMTETPDDKREMAERLKLYEQNKPYVGPAK